MQPNFERMIATISSRLSLIAGKMVNGDGVPCTTGALLLSVRPNLQQEIRVAAFASLDIGESNIRSSIWDAQELCGIGPRTWLVLQHFNDWCASVVEVNHISIRDAVLKMLITVHRNWNDTVACRGAEPPTRGGCDVLCAKLITTYWTHTIGEAQVRVALLSEDLEKARAAALEAERVLLTIPEVAPSKFSLAWLSFESEKLFFAPFKKSVTLADLYVKKSGKFSDLLVSPKVLDTLLPPITVAMAEALYPPALDEKVMGESMITKASPIDKAQQQIAIDDLIKSTQVDLAKANDEMIAMALFSKV